MSATQMIQQMPTRPARARMGSRHGQRKSNYGLGTTWSQAFDDWINNPVSATGQAFSELWGDLSSSEPGTDTVQNIAGSLSQSQIDAITGSCVAGVTQAGGTDTGQCASLVNSSVAQANAAPIDLSVVPSVPTWVWWIGGALALFMLYEVLS